MFQGYMQIHITVYEYKLVILRRLIPLDSGYFQMVITKHVKNEINVFSVRNKCEYQSLHIDWCPKKTSCQEISCSNMAWKKTIYNDLVPVQRNVRT